MPRPLRHAGPRLTEGEWLVSEDDSDRLVGVAYQFETERTWICWAVELRYEWFEDGERVTVTPVTAQRIGEEVQDLIEHHLTGEWELADLER
jgi:hypothetical protein